MKVKLHPTWDDMIVDINIKGIEVGRIPKGVGLDRVRWNGEKLIDLGTLNEIWVLKHISGKFTLHCKFYPDAQLVKMKHHEKPFLVNDGGLYRVLTQEERDSLEKEDKLGELKAVLRRELEKEIGDLKDQLADLSKLVFILCKALRGVDSNVASDLIYKYCSGRIEPLFTLDHLDSNTTRYLDGLNKNLGSYYKEKQNILEVKKDGR